MLPRPTIEAFDRHLTSLALRFEGVVIGGSALVLMDVVQRNTRDVDVLDSLAAGGDCGGCPRVREAAATGRQ